MKIDPVVKVKIRELAIIILLWIISIRIFILFYFISRGNDIAAMTQEPKALALLTQSLTNGTIAGIIIGLITGFFELFVFPKAYRHKPIIQVLTFKVLLYLAVMSFISLIALYVYECGYNDKDFNEYLALVQRHMSSRTYFAIFGFGLLISIEVNMLIFIRNKIGTRVFLPLILGKYHIPRREDRIFSFIDLKSSVEIAEKLKETDYSLLLQDCFKDLQDIIIRYKGQIYQFVGDECVITWKVKKRTDFNNPTRLFFAYKKLLKQKETYYKKKYNILPEFKGAIHSGIVSSAEVGGDIKSEIAYHGDVLNTSARIMEMCKKYGEDLLVTDQYLNRTHDIENEFEIEFKEKVILRGKNLMQKIYCAREYKK